jgi:hypothetical protein
MTSKYNEFPAPRKPEIYAARGRILRVTSAMRIMRSGFHEDRTGPSFCLVTFFHFPQSNLAQKTPRTYSYRRVHMKDFRASGSNLAKIFQPDRIRSIKCGVMLGIPFFSIYLTEEPDAEASRSRRPVTLLPMPVIDERRAQSNQLE